MSTEYAPGLDSYGFLVPYENEAIGELLQSAWDQAETFESTIGETRRLKSDYASLWVNFNDGSASTILEVGSAGGMAASIMQLVDKKEALIMVVDAHDPGPEVAACPFRIQCPQTWLGTLQPTEEQLPISLTLTAQSARFFNSEEELAADPELAEYGTAFFSPASIEDNLPATHQAFAIGRIILAIHTENNLTNGKFWALRVRTFAGEIWVAMPDASILEDPNGKFIAVHGVLSGSFPDLMPEAIDPDEEGGLDLLAMGQRVRELSSVFFSSEACNPFFYEVHPDATMMKVAKGIGLLSKGMRQSAKDMPVKRVLDSPELRARYLQVASTAELVMAPIVIANNQILEGNSGGPALVVIGFGEDPSLFSTLKDAQEILTRVHLEGPENAQEQELAALIEDEDYHFGRRRPLPQWLIGDFEAYAADLWIPKECIEHATLMMEIVLCLAERGPQGLTIAAPSTAVDQALDEQNNETEATPNSSTPPPIPPRSAGPPPIPPH